jgi:cobalt-precorrin 5A hydrolase
MLQARRIYGMNNASRNLVLGIGCRRGLSVEIIERSAAVLLWDKRIPLSRVAEIATIGGKQKEDGLIAFADAHKLPLRVYPEEELLDVEGELSPPDWVCQTVAADDICERAAVLCGGEGRLIVKKAVYIGIAVAVFERIAAM